MECSSLIPAASSKHEEKESISKKPSLRQIIDNFFLLYFTLCSKNFCSKNAFCIMQSVINQTQDELRSFIFLSRSFYCRNSAKFLRFHVLCSHKIRPPFVSFFGGRKIMMDFHLRIMK